MRASSWSSASNAMSAGSSPAGFGLYDEISVLVDADPVHGGDARVGGGEGDDGYTGGVEDQLRGGGHQCGTVLGYSGIQIGLGSIELNVVRTDRPLAAWSTATTAWCYTSRSDRRIPASVTSVPRTFLRIPNTTCAP